jgi:hypothetical protein
MVNIAPPRFVHRSLVGLKVQSIRSVSKNDYRLSRTLVAVSAVLALLFTFEFHNPPLPGTHSRTSEKGRACQGGSGHQPIYAGERLANAYTYDSFGNVTNFKGPLEELR